MAYFFPLTPSHKLMVDHLPVSELVSSCWRPVTAWITSQTVRSRGSILTLRSRRYSRSVGVRRGQPGSRGVRGGVRPQGQVTIWRWVGNAGGKRLCWVCVKRVRCFLRGFWTPFWPDPHDLDWFRRSLLACLREPSCFNFCSIRHQGADSVLIHLWSDGILIFN